MGSKRTETLSGELIFYSNTSLSLSHQTILVIAASSMKHERHPSCYSHPNRLSYSNSIFDIKYCKHTYFRAYKLSRIQGNMQFLVDLKFLMLLTLYCMSKDMVTLYIFSRICEKRDNMYNANISTFTEAYM